MVPFNKSTRVCQVAKDTFGYLILSGPFDRKRILEKVNQGFLRLHTLPCPYRTHLAWCFPTVPFGFRFSGSYSLLAADQKRTAQPCPYRTQNGIRDAYPYPLKQIIGGGGVTSGIPFMATHVLFSWEDWRNEIGNPPPPLDLAWWLQPSPWVFRFLAIQTDSHGLTELT